jgi:drug/metabolite transporter (DMT)-like permease
MNQKLMQRFLPHLALFTVSLIFGLNYFIAKSLMPDFLKPLQLIFFRVLLTSLILWGLHFVIKKERVSKRDMRRLALCGFVGISLNQIAMFVGLNLTTAVDTSIIHSTSPILVLIFSALLLRERIRLVPAIGIALGFSGSLMLILQSGDFDLSSSNMLGNVLIFINISAYGLYLVLVKPLMAKYHPITVMKWAFTFGFIFGAPLTVPSLEGFGVSHMTINAWLSLVYVIVAVTFIAFLLTAWALKSLSASTTAYYIYLQPLFAALIAWLSGLESLDWGQLFAAAFIFTGVYLVNYRKRNGVRANGGRE